MGFFGGLVFCKNKSKICSSLPIIILKRVGLLEDDAARCCGLIIINAQVLSVIGVGALTRLNAPMTITFQDEIVRSGCCSGFHLGLQGRSWSQSSLKSPVSTEAASGSPDLESETDQDQPPCTKLAIFLRSSVLDLESFFLLFPLHAT